MLIELAQKAEQAIKNFLFPTLSNKYRAGIFSGHFLVYFVIVILLLKIAIASFMAYFPRNAFFADITKTALIQMTNKERTDIGLPALKENPVLDRAAYMKAQDMIKNDYFSHTSPFGIDPWYWFRLAGYTYRYAGENLAIGFIDSSEVNDAWIDSPTHKANILNNKYQEVGIAVLTGEFQGKKTTVVVQLFGAKQPVYGSKTITPAKLAATGVKPDTKNETPAKPVVEEKKAPVVSAVKPQEEKAPVKTVENAAELPGYDKVLGTASENKAGHGLVSFASSGFMTLVQRTIYTAIIFVMMLLLANFLIKPDLKHKDLFFKVIAFVILLAAFVAFDKGVIIQLIPHDLAIF